MINKINYNLKIDVFNKSIIEFLYPEAKYLAKKDYALYFEEECQKAGFDINSMTAMQIKAIVILINKYGSELFEEDDEVEKLPDGTCDKSDEIESKEILEESKEEMFYNLINEQEYSLNIQALSVMFDVKFLDKIDFEDYFFYLADINKIDLRKTTKGSISKLIDLVNESLFIDNNGLSEICLNLNYLKFGFIEPKNVRKVEEIIIQINSNIFYKPRKYISEKLYRFKYEFEDKKVEKIINYAGKKVYVCKGNNKNIGIPKDKISSTTFSRFNKFIKDIRGNESLLKVNFEELGDTTIPLISLYKVSQYNMALIVNMYLNNKIYFSTDENNALVFRYGNKDDKVDTVIGKFLINEVSKLKRVLLTGYVDYDSYICNEVKLNNSVRLFYRFAIFMLLFENSEYKFVNGKLNGIRHTLIK